MGWRACASESQSRVSSLDDLSKFANNVTDASQALLDSTIALLLRTYSYYADRSSRIAVQNILQNDRFYPPHTLSLVEAYYTECHKQGLALSSAYVLVEWGSMILLRCERNQEALQEYGLAVLRSDAEVLETCMRTRKRPRRSVQDAAFRSTSRALRTILSFQGRNALEAIIDCLTSKSQPLGARSAIMLGITGDACINQPEMFQPFKKQVYAFYAGEILTSRTHVPKHIAAGLRGFFTNFTNLDDFRAEIVPALEKALLRAPEVVLRDLIPPLVDSLPRHLDLAEPLANNLLKPLLANAKSQTESIRNGAVAAYVMFVGHSSANDAIQKITTQLIDALLYSKAPIERHCIIRMLAGTSRLSSISNSACEALIKIIAKETHENTMGFEISTLLEYLRIVPPGSSSGILSSASEAAIRGLKDKKVTTRRLWILALGEFVWSSYEDVAEHDLELDRFINSVLGPMMSVHHEVVHNPIVAAQSGLAIASFVVTAIWPRVVRGRRDSSEAVSKNVASPISQALSENTPPSFLQNHRIYSKIDPQDMPWVVRALSSSCGSLLNSPLEFRVAWAEAFIYAISAAHIPPKQRQSAMTSLTSLYLENRVMISGAIIQALWKWCRDSEKGEKNTPANAAKTGTSRLLSVMHSICPISMLFSTEQRDSGGAAAQDQLINMLVLCRPEIIPGAHWIDMCLRVLEDPGMLTQTRASECLDRVETCLLESEGDDRSAKVQSAAYNTAAELAFIGPSAIIPLIVHKIESNLSAIEMSRYGPTEIAIARTPEGTAFVDVLNTQVPKIAIDKNLPDYEVAKWEQEIRHQIAQKTKQDKKLTADEKAKVNAQLQREVVIRAEVHGTESRFRTGAGYIRALAVGPPTDAKLWMGPSLRSLLEIIKAGAGQLIGDVADDAYLQCAKFVASRLGVQRRFIGIATLRTAGSATLPTHLLQESLQGTIRLSSRVPLLTVL